MNLKRIYRNSQDVPEGRYFAYIVDRRSARINEHTVHQVRFRIAASHQDYAGIELWSNLHLTEAGMAVFDRFKDSFRIDELDTDEVEGRHAKILIKHTSHKGTEYSEVRFLEQSDADLERSEELEEAYWQKDRSDEDRSEAKPKGKPQRWIEPDYPDLSTRENAWEVAKAFVDGEGVDLLP